MRCLSLEIKERMRRKRRNIKRRWRRYRAAIENDPMALLHKAERVFKDSVDHQRARWRQARDRSRARQNDGWEMVGNSFLGPLRSEHLRNSSGSLNESTLANEQLRLLNDIARDIVANDHYLDSFGENRTRVPNTTPLDQSEESEVYDTYHYTAETPSIPDGHANIRIRHDVVRVDRRQSTLSPHHRTVSADTISFSWLFADQARG